MNSFSENLRQRAEALGISNAEVARRAGLSERRYGNYITGRRQPDLALLVRIAMVLRSTPNELLGVTPALDVQSPRALVIDRLLTTAHAMSDDDLAITLAQAEALIALRRG